MKKTVKEKAVCRKAETSMQQKGITEHLKLRFIKKTFKPS